LGCGTRAEAEQQSDGVRRRAHENFHEDDEGMILSRAAARDVCSRVPEITRSRGAGNIQIRDTALTNSSL
jgi:hypothetical protein